MPPKHKKSSSRSSEESHSDDVTDPKGTLSNKTKIDTNVVSVDSSDDSDSEDGNRTEVDQKEKEKEDDVDEGDVEQTRNHDESQGIDVNIDNIKMKTRFKSPQDVIEYFKACSAVKANVQALQIGKDHTRHGLCYLPVSAATFICNYVPFAGFKSCAFLLDEDSTTKERIDGMKNTAMLLFRLYEIFLGTEGGVSFPNVDIPFKCGYVDIKELKFLRKPSTMPKGRTVIDGYLKAKEDQNQKTKTEGTNDAERTTKQLFTNQQVNKIRSYYKICSARDYQKDLWVDDLFLTDDQMTKRNRALERTWEAEEPCPPNSFENWFDTNTESSSALFYDDKGGMKAFDEKVFINALIDLEIVYRHIFNSQCESCISSITGGKHALTQFKSVMAGIYDWSYQRRTGFSMALNRRFYTSRKAYHALQRLPINEDEGALGFDKMKMKFKNGTLAEEYQPQREPHRSFDSLSICIDKTIKEEAEKVEARQVTKKKAKEQTNRERPSKKRKLQLWGIENENPHAIKTPKPLDEGVVSNPKFPQRSPSQENSFYAGGDEDNVFDFEEIHQSEGHDSEVSEDSNKINSNPGKVVKKKKSEKNKEKKKDPTKELVFSGDSSDSEEDDDEDGKKEEKRRRRTKTTKTNEVDEMAEDYAVRTEKKKGHKTKKRAHRLPKAVRFSPSRRREQCKNFDEDLMLNDDHPSMNTEMISRADDDLDFNLPNNNNNENDIPMEQKPERIVGVVREVKDESIEDEEDEEEDVQNEMRSGPIVQSSIRIEQEFANIEAKPEKESISIPVNQESEDLVENVTPAKPKEESTTNVNYLLHALGGPIAAIDSPSFQDLLTSIEEKIRKSENKQFKLQKVSIPLYACFFVLTENAVPECSPGEESTSLRDFLVSLRAGISFIRHPSMESFYQEMNTEIQQLTVRDKRIPVEVVIRAVLAAVIVIAP